MRSQHLLLHVIVRQGCHIGRSSGEATQASSGVSAVQQPAMVPPVEYSLVAAVRTTSLTLAAGGQPASLAMEHVPGLAVPVGTTSVPMAPRREHRGQSQQSAEGCAHEEFLFRQERIWVCLAAAKSIKFADSFAPCSGGVPLGSMVATTIIDGTIGRIESVVSG